MTNLVSPDASNPVLGRATARGPFAWWTRSFSRVRRITELFQLADVAIGGDRPWDIHVHNDQFYRRMMAGGSLGLGESYMDGDWDCEALDQFFDRVISRRLGRRSWA